MLYNFETGYINHYLLNSTLNKTVSFFNHFEKFATCPNNKQVLATFLGKQYLPLRYTYIYDIRAITTFVKLIKFLDLPYRLDSTINNLWRYKAKAYGTYFDKKKRSFVLFFQMGFKKNIGVLLSFFMNYPSQTHLLHVIDWHKFSFLFQKTLFSFNKNITSKSLLSTFYTTNNFFPINKLNRKLIPISPHIFLKKFHRSINLADIDINPWLTTYDFRFYSTDIYDKNYQTCNLDKLDFSWGVHKHFITSSFFITSFDTRTILYPELYFKYINKFYSQDRFLQTINFFNKKAYKDSYISILNLFSLSYLNKIIIILNTKNNYLNLNANYLNLNNFNTIFFLLLFFYNNKTSLKNIKKNLYFFFPSKVTKAVVFKNYFSFRSRKYNRKYNRLNKHIFLAFRSYFAFRLPTRSKFNKWSTRNLFFIKKSFRSFYTNFIPMVINGCLERFWDYFFYFFLQNIKRRFCYFFNDIKIFCRHNSFDTLFFIKKYVYFNRFIRKYFNSEYSLKKIFSSYKESKNLINLDFNNLNFDPLNINSTNLHYAFKNTLNKKKGPFDFKHFQSNITTLKKKNYFIKGKKSLISYNKFKKFK